MKRWLLLLSFTVALTMALAGGAFRELTASRGVLQVGVALGWSTAPTWGSTAGDLRDDLADPLGTRSPLQEEENQEERGETSSKGKTPMASTAESWTSRSLALRYASLKAGAPAGTVALSSREAASHQHSPRAPPPHG